MAGFVAAFANPCNYIGGVNFSPEKDIPDLSNKVALVTGGMFSNRAVVKSHDD
jgi:hypothetical protein